MKPSNSPRTEQETSKPEVSLPGTSPTRGFLPLLLGLVAVAGAGTMTVELAAVRVLAPWFGASSGVWTNVIGVILLALALGYLVGARLSRSGAPLRRLALTLAIAAFPVGWIPTLAAPVADAFLPSGLGLDQAAGLLVWGSLATTVVLFLPAALVLGCVGPLAVEAVQSHQGGHAGDAGGRVLGASTLGSLAGTFATTHLFLPSLGIRATFHAAACVLLLLAAVALYLDRRRPGPLALLLVPLGASSLLGGYAPPRPGTDWVVLEETQSPYQSLRVVETRDGKGDPIERRLQVNEGLDSFQSVWQPDAGLLPAGYYYNLFSLPPWWETERPDTWRTLILGLGAGTTVRVLEGALPRGTEVETVGVEIDPEVVALGERWFDLQSSPRHQVWTGDARAALRIFPGPFDQIVLDAYANNMEVPAHLASEEFFHSVQGALRPGGWLVVNAAGFGLDDPVVRAVSGTLAAAFGSRVLCVRVPFSRNCVLFARRDAVPVGPEDPNWRVPSAGHRDLLGRLMLPGAWTWIEVPASAPLTDDSSALDRMQLESVLAGRGRWIE